MRRGFKSNCEKTALRLRRELGAHGIDPLGALELASHLRVPIFEIGNIPGLDTSTVHQLNSADPSGWSALTVYTPRGPVVVHNPSHSAGRTESNLMHELSHIILKHEPMNLVQLPEFPVTLREFNQIEEEEAAWLGGALQLPRKALLWAIRQGMTNWQIAQAYRASRDMVRFRRNVTGIDHQIRRERGQTHQ